MEITDEVNTLYIGGGTPSVLPLSVFESIIGALKCAGHGGPFDEFTVEVNPDDIRDFSEMLMVNSAFLWESFKFGFVGMFE